MNRKLSAAGLVVLSLSFAGSLLAIVPEWAQGRQCGGSSYYTGDTSRCPSPSVCNRDMVHENYYSQCQSSPPPATIVEPRSSPASASAEFVTTSGTNFMLGESKYTVVGENAYWVGLTGITFADMNAAFADIAKTGATTVRTWGFNEITSASSNGTTNYYQIWSGSTPTINTGLTGLQNFDNVVAAAKANGIRLIVTLTNNWSDYGGMDVYVKQILGSNYHDLFYTDARVIDAYKNYVKTFVGRYVDEPTIMAWELANEPRCAGTIGNSVTTGTCTTITITSWAKELSAFIKTIDDNHLLAIGDEGFYNRPHEATKPYQGIDGIDFDANIAINTIDFGTFHSYPTSWGQGGNETTWGIQWIVDHVASQTKAGKPVILEEFGVITNQPATYTAWLNEALSSGLTGYLIWQAGSHLSSGDTPNDGYAIYPDSAVYSILTSHASALKSRS